MNNVFAIEICNKDQEVELQLPATDYQLLDVMEKLGIIEEVKPSVSIYQYGEGFENLADVLDHDDLNLFELNALAKRLSQFNRQDMMAFHSLVSTRLEYKEDNIPVQELLDFAYSTDCCEVQSGIETFEELGHFYVENDLIPELKGIPDESLPFLDYETIGKKFSEKECGVLVPGGYVTQSSELKEVAKNMTFAPPTPNYTILLEISKGYFNDPAYDNEKTILLSLPAEPGKMDAALDTIGAWDWREVGFRCLDCCAPALIPHIDGDDNIAHINRLAQRMQMFDDKQLTKFKAVLEATEEYSVLGATDIAYNLDDYLFSPQFLEPEDMARDFLESGMGPGAETLEGFVNLLGYGHKLMEEQNCVLTDYGMVNREDGQALKGHTAPAKQIQRGMEEMTM